MLAVVNKIHWCVAVGAVNGRPGLVLLTVDRRNCWSHSTSHRSESQILVANRDFYLPHLHSTPTLWGPRRNIAMPFGMKKLEWCTGYVMVKIFWRYLYSFRQNTRTWQTDTARRHIPRLSMASRGKNDYSCRWETARRRQSVALGSCQ